MTTSIAIQQTSHRLYSTCGAPRTHTTNGPWTHTSDDSYIYQLTLVLATAIVSFIYHHFLLSSSARGRLLPSETFWTSRRHTGLYACPRPLRVFVFIAHKVQHSHCCSAFLCSSGFHRIPNTSLECQCCLAVAFALLIFIPRGCLLTIFSSRQFLGEVRRAPQSRNFR